jgi:Na+/melibiose symporter-like transporter
MTIETAVFVFAAGMILVALLIWQTHRLTGRRLAKIQTDLDALHQASQWLLVKGLNRESDGTARSEPVEKITPQRRDR